MISPRVNLVIACLFSDKSVFENVLEECTHIWGNVDYVSKSFVFDSTDYYASEMGPGLYRCFLSFKVLITPEECLPIKHICTDIEKKFSISTNRTVNLDAGYIDTYKYVLFSYKEGGHKLFIGDGVWADMTLMYKKGTWYPFTWTFPDFKNDRYYRELITIREYYKIKLKEIAKFS